MQPSLPHSLATPVSGKPRPSPRRRWARAAALACAVLLSACGGGGGGEPAPTPSPAPAPAPSVNRAPVANAGPDATGVVGIPAAFSGAASSDPDGDPLSYQWSLSASPAGSQAALSQAQTAAPTFTPDVAGLYSLSLVVSDGRLSSPADTLSFTVRPSAIDADVALASAAKLNAVLDAQAANFTLRWTDTFPQGSAYRVERLGSTGFELQETLAGAGGQNLGLQWQRPLGGGGIYRVVATGPGRSVSLLAASGQSTLNIQLPAPAPGIEFDKPEPVSGPVQLSVSGAVAAQAVSWFADLRLLGAGSSAAPYAITWDTTRETNGPHLVLARLQLDADRLLELRRPVAVANAKLSVSASASGQTGLIDVDVRASGENGIARVEATLGGNSLGSLSAPNACSRLCGGKADVYRFTIDSAAVGSGTYTFVAKAIDTIGASQQASLTLTISNPPGISLSAPADGAFLFGNLDLAGSARSDKPGTLSVVATLGDYPLLQTSGPHPGVPFSTRFNLAGLNPGTYTLRVRATDAAGGITAVQRTLVVASSSELAHAPLFKMGAQGQALATDGQRLLYSTPEGGIRLRDLVSATEVALSGAAGITSPTDWQIEAGRVYVQGKGPDCVITCIYEWQSDGSMFNLSNANPYSGSGSVGGGRTYDLHPVARWPYVAWINWVGPNPGTYTVFDASTRSYSAITQPAGVNYLGNWYYDLAQVGNTRHFVYWAQTGGEGSNSVFDVFRWNTDTRTSTRVTSGGARNVYTQTDGQRLAWMRGAVGSSTGGPQQLMA